MSLETLELLPRGESGWGSEVLRFGRITTLLLGSNGAGKTPILKALDYCLGHPVELPPLVKEKCRAVAVSIRTPEGLYKIERQLTTGVQVMLTDPSGATVSIETEQGLSEWILPKLGVSLRTLTSKSGGKVHPYMSIVGPMFLVNQDTGWTTSYVPFDTHNFVKDQQEEIIRWFLELPIRNRPTDRSGYQKAKENLASIQEQIAFKRNALEILTRELGEDRAADAYKSLETRRASLEASLSSSSSVVESISQVESPLQVRVREAISRRDDILYKLTNARKRKTQLIEVQADVGAELGALEQNEVAAEAFRNLCGYEVCQFFRSPEDSYGRRVLYLRDQLKDFESSTSQTEDELQILHQQLANAEEAVDKSIELFNLNLVSDSQRLQIAAIEATSLELADIRVRIDRLARIANVHEQLEALINAESRAADRVDELRPSAGPRRDLGRLLDARQILSATFKEWLLALRTPNVPGDVSFDEELHLIVNGERFTSKASFSGSTRTRLILSFHAALVETSLELGGSHPRLLVLDAPRQHELSAVDLRSYIERFYAMSAKHSTPVQLVFSATDPQVIPHDLVDALWEPNFLMNEERRFLGLLKK